MACSLMASHASVATQVRSQCTTLSGRSRIVLPVHLSQHSHANVLHTCGGVFSAGHLHVRRQRLRVCATAAGNTASTPPAGPPGLGSRKPSNNKKVNNVPILGTITQNLSNGKFRVKLVNGVAVIAHLSGKIRKNKIKIAVGDEVTVELSAYDLTRGRISRRH